ncbi:DUF1800 domain-containing protein [Roseibacillus ishigakijimensis]|uniref:DUF1800 domain-containing protein n=1 Tax=Roseibacillus ishigakijimensis TaxID=454146 RepID=A0A934RNX1_9BACT|nr:DUF1800 domain-containing protein [Roseibacillus ishigakijimensis]MBK1834839.1 DUF1800 domain-containing protein [Roseibacillus ishigakijimensis]
MDEISDDWTKEEAAHLLNRAGFGGTPQEINKFHQRGRYAAVDWLLEARNTKNFEPLAWTKVPGEKLLADFQEQQKELRALDGKERELLRREQNQERNRTYREQSRSLVGQWINRMIRTEAPLTEKMMLFWHDHFPVSSQKVRFAKLLWMQQELFRKEALGNFGRLTHGIAQDPAMMIYLDSVQSSKRKPNENFARELLELFTLGEGHYSEEDIKEAARAFTGYRLERYSGKVHFQKRQWDEGEKTILGKTAKFDGAGVVSHVLTHPRCGQYLAGKLWRFFAYDNPSEELISRLGQLFTAQNYELRPLLREIFLSPEFYTAQALRSQIKSPIDYLVMMHRQLELPAIDPLVSEQVLKQLGQVPYDPPNVAGWDWGQAWVNTNTLLSRYHLAGIVTGVGGDPAMMTGGKGRPFLNRGLQKKLRQPDFEKLVPREMRKEISSLVDDLAFRLFQSPLSEKNRTAFESYARAKKGAVFTNTEVAELVHLMMSTPAYQLT